MTQARRAPGVPGPACAGPGSRCYAFAIDWHVRVLAALAWILAAELALRPSLTAVTRPTLIMLVPAGALYFLYHPVLELIWRGQSPGKRYAGLRVVDRGGGVPSRRQILIRNLFRLIDSLPLFYAVGLISCFITAESVRLGDLAAGTLLVEDAVAPAADPADGREIARGLLERWGSMAPARRRELARALLDRVGNGSVAGLSADAGDEELRARLRAWCARP